MLTSITPLGERGRNSRWSVTVSAYAIGSTLAGTLLGACAGGLGDLFSGVFPAASSRVLILAGAALVGVGLDLGLGGLRLPSVARQVNEDWLRSYRGWVYGVGFGFQLGLGFVTVVSASAVYLAFLAALLNCSAPAGALIGAAFGFSRAAVLFLAAGVDTTDRLLSLGDRLAHWRQPALLLSISAQVAFVLAALTVALG
jgi:sulfite exporter TauE/SafE